MAKNIVGQRIKIARALHRPPLSQSNLLARVQILELLKSQPTLSKIESEERPVMDSELVVFAKALNVDILWLLGEKEMII